jgi:hypothetical protein
MKKHAGDISDTLEELPNFIGKTVGPHLLVFVHLHKVSIFKDITCDIVNDGANVLNSGVRGWRDSFQEDAFSRKRISAMKQQWTSAKCRCWHEFFSDDAINHMGST